MSSARRLSALFLVVLTTLATLAGVVGSASAAPAPPPPPPGPVNGTGNFEGTEAVLDEALIDTTCFFRNTRTVFALRGAGTFAGTTSSGQPVAYKAEIGANQSLYADGPIQIEVESTATYYHGPGGTFGTSTADCTAAHTGGSVPAVARIFAPDHVYRLHEGGAQVPCVGTGSFYRYGGDWHADWSLDGDCTVIGNAAGTPGTGAALQGSLFTHDGQHSPCSDVCNDNIRFDFKEYLAIPGSGITLVGSADSAQVGDNVTATARVTNDGVAQSGVTVTFNVAGPGATTPPSGSAVTGADGRATFAFTASTVGDYTVTATAPSATDPGQTITATLAVEFTPPDPPTIVVSGPATGHTEESTTFTALFTDARVPVAGSTINFSVTGAGAATPSSGSAVTSAAGKATFSFAGGRAGSYTVTASTTYNAQTVTGTATTQLSINTFYNAGILTAASGENQFTSAVIDPGGQFGYFGTTTSPAQVVKVDLATMTRAGAIALASGENNLTSAVLDASGTFAYFGTNTSPGRVVKIDLASFTRVGAITLPSGENNLASAVLDGPSAYFGTAASAVAGRVVKIDLASFTRVGAVTLASDETQLLAAVKAPGGGSAYFAAKGSGTNPGRLVKIDLATFTRAGAAPLVGADENRVPSAVIDPAGAFAYLGTDSYPSRVIKVDLGAMSRVGALTVLGPPFDDEEGFDSAELLAAVMAPDGAHAYFGASPSGSSAPRQVIEIDLATFTRARTVNLPVGEANLRSAVIAPDGAHAWFGTANSPGHVVKVALVRPPKAALVAGADTYTTAYAVPVTAAAPGVLANDVDSEDGDALVAGQASDPAGGSVTLNPNGSFTYTPDVGFTGTDTFTYTASDNQDYSAPATVSVSVGVAPEDVSDTFGGALGYFTNVGLFGGPREDRGPAPVVTLPRTGGDVSATDPDGAAAIYGPAYIFENHGPLNVHTQGTTGPGGSVTSSSDVYNVEDNDPFHAGSPDGQVSSTCAATSDGVSGSTHIVNGYLVTHTDPATGDAVEEIVFDHDYDPAPNTEFNGALDHVGDQWRIVLNEQIVGPDSITVNAVHMYLLGPTARGEMIIGQSRCGVQVAAANAAPVATDDPYSVTGGQGPLEIAGPGVLGNDTDADGQALTAAKLTPIAAAAQDDDWTFPSDPDHGSLVLNSDGSFAYTPDAGYTGPDSFTYLSQDARGKTDVGTVAITVNAAPVATDDTYGTTADAPLVVAAPGVLGNDTDADGGTLTAGSASDPLNGSVTLNADGSFTYTPDAAYTGPDSFTYTLSDGQGGTDTGQVNITVNAANAAPVAGDDSYTTNEDTALTVNAPGVLGNDTDADANPLSAGSATDPPNGSVVLNPNGSFTYTPDANVNGLDTFDYTVSDGQGGTDTGTVTVDVSAVNDAPLATDDTYATDEDTPLTVPAPGVLTNDTDVEGSTLSAGSATDPPHGSVVFNTDGSFTYTPDANYHGPDSFTYTASDGAGGTDTAVVSITVTSVAEAPVAGDDTYSINNGTPLTIAAPGVLANDTDGDGDPLTAGAASDPPGGSVTLNADGSFTYDADPGFTGTDTFTYTVSDGPGGTDTGSVTITVLPGQAMLLKDLNPEPTLSAPDGFVQMGNAVYFVSTAAASEGVWRTDGTEAGTALVASMNADELIVWDDHLYFTANDGLNGYELWKSDGTTAGTELVKDINPGAADGFPFEKTVVGSVMFFAADDGIHGYELWKSDGTAAGTTFVKDINVGTANSDLFGFTDIGSTVVFGATDGSTTGMHGTELWKTDGTEAGTILVKDIRPGTGSGLNGAGAQLTRFGNTAVFTANNGAGVLNNELWTTDGTEAGTVMVKEIRPGTGGATPGSYVVVGNQVLFSATDGTTGRELWKTDGTSAGTVMVKDISTGSAASAPDRLTVSGANVFFTASDGTTTGLHGTELWKTDGTAAGTVMVKDINTVLRTTANPGTQDSSIRAIAVFDGRVYFYANDGSHGYELWRSDGTAANTVLVQDINPGPAESRSVFSSAGSPTPLLGTVFFAADDGIHGLEPWRLTPAPTNPALVAVDDAYSTDEGTTLTVAAPGVLANDTGGGAPLTALKVGEPVHGSVTLSADGSFIYTPAVGYTGADSFSYWASDGTSASNLATVGLTVVPDRVSLLKDLNPGSGMSSPIGFTQLGGYAYFFSVDPATTGLWRTDGTEAGTTLVKSITVIEDGQFLKLMGDHLYFTADDGVTGRELWKTDGTAAGTVLVKDINPGSAGAEPLGLTLVGSTLFFRADDGTNGVEVWKSDGTAAGTALVKDIRTGADSSDPSGFTAVGGTVVFAANNGSTTGLQGAELWRTDGTDAGTVLVKDIRSGTASSSPSRLIAFGGIVLFAANNGTTTGLQGNELWKTDGTAAGTVLVKDINVGTGSSSPNRFAVVGDRVMFAANGPGGLLLWKTDGTTAGTVLVKGPADGPVPGFAGQFGFVAFGNTLFFSGSDGTTTGSHGHELWKSDGTAAGTVMIKDINTTLRTTANPGTADANPTELEVFDGNVYFVVNDGIHGKEMWRTDGTEAGTVLVQDIYPGPEGGVETTSPGALTALLGTVFFSANDGIHADEPWRLAPASANQPPVAVDDAYSTNEDGSLTVPAPGVLGNDTDADANPLTAAKVTDPAHGTVVLNSDGSFTYTPAAGYHGSDSFTYKANDGTADSGVATVALTVNSVNEAPVAGDDAYTTSAGTPLTVPAPGVLGNDTDGDGDPLTAGSPSDPANGSVTLNADGSFTYTTDLAGFSGSDSFTYTASDGQGGTDTATVAITVTPASGPTAFSVADFSVAEGNAGTTAATFTVTRSGNASGTSTVKYKTSGGTAAPGSDYTAVALSTLSFAPFEVTKTVTVDVAADTVPEKDETLNLMLSASTGAVIADNKAIATLLNDDGSAYLAVDSVTVTEGNAATTPATFTISRSGNTDGSSTASYRTSGGTATAGTDYTAVGPTGVTFAPGETTKTVTVDVAGDLTVENNETFNLVLSAASVGTVVADGSGAGTIVDDEGPITAGPATFVSVGNLSVAEGNSGTTVASFTVTRSGDTSGASTVKVKTGGGTATAGADYTAVPLTTVSFGAGETAETVTVDVAGDTLPETDEPFNLMLSAATGATIADTSGTATVRNDDGAAYLAVANTSVTEGDSGTTTATFTLTRSGNTTGGSTVKVRTAGGSASAGVDYVALGLTDVTFAPGETAKTVIVDVVGDGAVEPNETFNLQLSAAVGATISDPTGAATIVNDD